VTSKEPKDHNLGEERAIPRRDFLQGALLAAATTLTGVLSAKPAPAAVEFPGAQDHPGYYPPQLTGLRGSHVGSFEAAHAARDGKIPADARDTGQTYDLIVVGGGISGLSAAYFYRSRKSRPSRVLILDNHDDFGGHAKRNEFELDGRLQLLNGGTLAIDSPRPYSPVAAGLIRDLGIDDVEAMSRRIEDHGFYRSLGLGGAVFLDRETFGADFLGVGLGSVPVAKLFEKSPLSAQARADIERVEEGTTDYFPELTSAQKKPTLSKMSYRDFLVQVVKVDPQAAAYYQTRTNGFWGVGFDAINALDCWALGFPGFKGLRLEPGSIPHMGYSAAGIADTGGSKRLHFPDGNASIARLLVRKLLPEAVPGHSADDIVTSRVLYDRLDIPGSDVRLRLSSTAVRVQNVGSNSNPSGVAVTYVRDGAAYTVRGKQCVLACWNMMIPYLCPDLPDKQKAALHSLVKAPLVYTSVALRNWEAFAKLKVAHISAPGSYHTSIALNAHVNVGEYRSSASAKEPVLVHMTRVPWHLGLPEHEQNKVGRAELLGTPFATFERNIRDQLSRMLGAGGFDPSADIEAITVNRWPHGYAPEYNPLWDPDLPPDEQPNIVGRARFGNITIANSDSGRAAYTDSAIDQADRAVNELLQA